MLRTWITSAICLFGVVAIAEEISPKVKRVIELGEIRRKQRISELEGGLKAIKAQYEVLKKSTKVEEDVVKDKTTHRMTTPAEIAQRKEKEIQVLKDRAAVALQEIEFIKRQKYFCPTMTLKTMEVGDVGILADPYGTKLTAKITQIVDDESAIISVDSQTIMLTVDTSGLKVGKKFSLTMPFEVIGTTVRKSGNGTKEVFVLEQFFFPEDDRAPKETASSRSTQPR